MSEVYDQSESVSLWSTLNYMGRLNDNELKVKIETTLNRIVKDCMDLLLQQRGHFISSVLSGGGYPTSHVVYTDE